MYRAVARDRRHPIAPQLGVVRADEDLAAEPLCKGRLQQARLRAALLCLAEYQQLALPCLRSCPLPMGFLPLERSPPQLHRALGEELLD